MIGEVRLAKEKWGVQLEQATKEEQEELRRRCFAQNPMLVAKECFYPFRDNIDFEAI